MDPASRPSCLNCGTPLTDRFCPHCGQKAQPTRLPLREVLGEVSSTFLNLDGLFVRTFTRLFSHPGQVTRDYNAGKRAAFLPPLRSYLAISVIYFVTRSFIGQDNVLFINFSNRDVDQVGAERLGALVQYTLFLLVPALAGLLQALRCRRGGYYVEYLVFAVHLHSVWFGLFWLQLVLSWSLGFLPAGLAGFATMIDRGASGLTQIAPFLYLVLGLRGAFGLPWWVALAKGTVAIALYLFLIGGAMAVYFAAAGV